jgi:2-oxo-3-hexenedioate decarboxylase
MDERALLGCLDGVAHGFELVQSIFPHWEFSAPDAVAAFGVHGALLLGPWQPVAGHDAAWDQTLSTFRIDLQRDGVVVDQGRASNVLGGPLSALRHLVEVLASDPGHPSLAAGEIITTGTLTGALPVLPGESWTTGLTGVALDGIAVRFE